MSTAETSVGIDTGKTNLRTRALQGGLIGVLQAIFLSQDPGLVNIVKGLNRLLPISLFPTPPWQFSLWEGFYALPFPDYVFQISAVFGTFGIIFALVKFLGSDEKLERLSSPPTPSTLEDADMVNLLLVLSIGVYAFWSVDYPLEPIPVLQGILVLGQSSIYVLIPTILRRWFPLPNQTRNLIIKVAVLFWVFVLGTLFTIVINHGIYTLEYGI